MLILCAHPLALPPPDTNLLHPYQRRRAILVDLSISLFFPLFSIILYYFVQGHRFDIIEQIGCFPVLVNCLPAIFLIDIWPLIFGTLSVIYFSWFISLLYVLASINDLSFTTVLTLCSLRRRRNETARFITSNCSALTSSRYIRLLGVASTDALFTLPLSSIALYGNLRNPLYPWRGLADIHWGFSRVEQVAAAEWRRGDGWAVNGLYQTRYSVIVCAVIFLAFFGFSGEAREFYWRGVVKVGEVVGLKMKEGKGVDGSTSVLG